MGIFTEDLNHRLKAQADYARGQYQSFMTASEWRNVEMAQEFAKALQDNRSMFRFPYLRQVIDLWKIVFKSYFAARKYNSHRELLFSEYFLMTLFVAFFTTMETLPRVLLSTLLFPFLAKTNASEMQTHLANYFSDYAKKLESIPFYNHPYADIRRDLKQKYRACQNHSWVDWWTWKMLAFELFSREWLSKPLRYWFNQEENTAATTTDILVKYQGSSLETAKEDLKQLLSAINNPEINLVDDEVYAKDQLKTKDGQTYVSTYARISVPRYLGFKTALNQLAEHHIHLRKIAGHDQVQVKCEIENEVQDRRNALEDIKPIQFLYDYGDRIHPNRRICLFDAKVKDLHQTISRIEEQEVNVCFIHNF